MNKVSIYLIILTALLLFALVAHRKNMQRYRPHYIYRSGSGAASNLAAAVVIVFAMVIIFLTVGLHIKPHPAIFAVLLIITIFLGSRANKYTAQQKKILYEKEQRASRKRNPSQ